MDKSRYKEIAERSKGNKMMLCYEVFCEEKGKIPLQQFQESLPHWVMTQKVDDILFTGNIKEAVEQGLKQIVEYLDVKYNK